MPRRSALVVPIALWVAACGENARVASPDARSRPMARLSVSGLAFVDDTVAADASASTAPAGIVSYRFDFGDGHPPFEQESPVAAHAYRAGGTFLVSVTVRDGAGEEDSASAQVHISRFPLRAMLSAPDGALVGAPVSFDASSSSGIIGASVTYS